MKVILIGPSYPFRGGIAHYTTQLYRNLKIRHDVLFFSFKRQYPKWLFPGKTDIDPSQKHIFVPGAERLIDSMNPLTWLVVSRRIIKAQADVLIIPWWVSFWAPAFITISVLVKLFSRTKILFVCHNVVAHESTFFDKFLTKSVLKQGDFYIVHSNEEKRNLLRIIPEANVKKNFHPTNEIFKFLGHDHHSGQCGGGLYALPLQAGINPAPCGNIGRNGDHGQFLNHNPQELKEKFGLSGAVLLFFGFVREYKGLKYLIKAMPQILNEIPVTLLIAGEFWKDKKAYLDLIDKNGLKDHVVIVDEYIPNEWVGVYFHIADLVVQPYISATGSGVVQVAFGFNKPVIATRVGSLSEIIQDGKTGYLVSPKSSYEIANAVIKYFQSSNSEIFQKNIKAANFLFSWENLVATIDTLVSEKGHAITT